MNRRQLLKALLMASSLIYSVPKLLLPATFHTGRTIPPDQN